MRADPLRIVAHAHDGRAACGEAATRRCATQSLSAQTDRAFGGAHPVCGSPPAPTACAVQLLRPSPGSSSTGVVHSVRPRTVPPGRVQSAPFPRRATRRSARRSRETCFVPGPPAGPPSVFDGYGSPASERPVSSVCRPGRPGLSCFVPGPPAGPTSFRGPWTPCVRKRRYPIQEPGDSSLTLRTACPAQRAVLVSSRAERRTSLIPLSTCDSKERRHSIPETQRTARPEDPFRLFRHPAIRANGVPEMGAKCRNRGGGIHCGAQELRGPSRPIFPA